MLGVRYTQGDYGHLQEDEDMFLVLWPFTVHCWKDGRCGLRAQFGLLLDQSC